MQRDFDDSDNDFSYYYKSVSSHDSYHQSYHYEYWSSKMNWVVAVLVVVGAVVLLALLCRCCCGGKKRGRVLAPPTDNSTAQAPYPQQQYAATPYNIAAMPVMHAAAPAGPYYPGAPYPTHHVVPLQAEAVSPYPPPAPYPHPAAPYPHPPHAPNAPADACPPSYEQVVGACEGKQPPYNPNVPH